MGWGMATTHFGLPPAPIHADRHAAQFQQRQELCSKQSKDYLLVRDAQALERTIYGSRGAL